MALAGAFCGESSRDFGLALDVAVVAKLIRRLVEVEPPAEKTPPMTSPETCRLSRPIRTKSSEGDARRAPKLQVIATPLDAGRPSMTTTAFIVDA